MTTDTEKDDMDIGRSLRKMVVIVGMSLLGAVIGVVAGVFIGTVPGFSGSSSGGWDGIGTAVGLVFLAGGLGLLGLIGGAWQGVRIAARKTSGQTDRA